MQMYFFVHDQSVSVKRMHFMHIEKGNYHLAGKFNYTRRGNLAPFCNHYFLGKNLSGPTYLDLIFFIFLFRIHGLVMMGKALVWRN